MKAAMQFLLRGYKRWISPMLPHACRFVPTCSEYAMEAVEIHGALRGSWLAVTRLLRCHPFARAGHDPVPEHLHSASPVCDPAGSAAFSAARESLSRHY
jgi:putative membrane protein insertion efficiency factor